MWQLQELALLIEGLAGCLQAVAARYHRSRASCLADAEEIIGQVAVSWVQVSGSRAVLAGDPLVIQQLGFGVGERYTIILAPSIGTAGLPALVQHGAGAGRLALSFRWRFPVAAWQALAIIAITAQASSRSGSVLVCMMDPLHTLNDSMAMRQTIASMFPRSRKEPLHSPGATLNPTLVGSRVKSA